MTGNPETYSTEADVRALVQPAILAIPELGTYQAESSAKNVAKTCRRA